jgi:hypothetical protein
MSRWQNRISSRSIAAAVPALRRGTYLLLILLLFTGVASLAAQPEDIPATVQPPAADNGEGLPSDAEVYRTLQPEILGESREGNAINVTIQIPAAADTFVSSGQPSTNWSNAPNLRLGYNQSNDLGAERIYLFFDVASFVPGNATISSAFVEGYQHAFSPAGDGPMGVELRHLNSSWDASQITWNNHLPAWGSVFGQGEIPATIGFISGDVTELVREWVYGTRANYGMIFVGDETPQDRERIFHSLNANNGLFPRLVVDYSVVADNVAPVATVEALPRFVPSVFRVRWSGTDTGGSGLAYYDVRYRVQGGSWVDWQFHTTATAADFQGGANGTTYEFVARAVDNAGNQQPWSNTPQAFTTVDSQVPNVAVNPLPQFTYTPSFIVNWSGTDNLSGIVHYDVEYNINNGPWQPWFSQTTITSAQFTGGRNGNVYGFRARATDRVGNVQPLPAAPQATTTVSIIPPTASIIPFVSNVTNVLTFNVRWQGQAAPGATITGYDVQYRFNGGPWQSWLNNVPETFATFTATQGDGLYEFQVRARDSIGRVGDFRGGPGSGVIVDNTPPFIEPLVYLPAVFR